MDDREEVGRKIWSKFEIIIKSLNVSVMKNLLYNIKYLHHIMRGIAARKVRFRHSQSAASDVAGCS